MVGAGKGGRSLHLMVVHFFHLRYMESINRKIMVQAGPGINARPNWKNT
jgi:hypothetical protein